MHFPSCLSYAARVRKMTLFEFGCYGDAEFSHLLLVYTDVDFSFIFEIKPLLSIVI